MNKFVLRTAIAVLFVSVCLPAFSQEHSYARRCSEQLLNAIRGDFARPTVHARNLYHTSLAMYDAWAVYDETSEPVFLGQTMGDYTAPFDGFTLEDGYTAEQAKNISVAYAAYRLMKYRFASSPGFAITSYRLDTMMFNMELDGAITTTDYSTGSPIALGNYIAEQMIAFGETDFANEDNDYENEFYQPVNEPLVMNEPGNPSMTDPNRWQPLALLQYIDQSGNEVNSTPGFLSPEWGAVVPFSLQPEDATIYQRDGFDYVVYHDPGMPPQLDTTVQTGLEDPYKFGYAMVAIWSAQLDPEDGVLLDISPRSLGNIDLNDFPTTFEDMADFYDMFAGGDIGEGYDVNPATGEPYEPQYVPRGDYGRILAEFWADGPDSETPPGHWFTLLNYVHDHPLFERKWRGKGEIVDDLEWDVKAYLTLGGAMHDCAVAAWGIKGWYDYIRPVSAIRYMGDLGQSTDPLQPHYHPGGLPLVQDYIELVDEFDPLAGDANENVGKIKIKSWKGPDYIPNPNIDVAGVDWILAEEWWPYQRPTFVTPPFAGFVSGHSTFSRAAAEIMTMITGDAYFPGGMGEFEAPYNDFLVFEDGPSMDITLQWATYRDASDQCSLSRIWGGIHPPADDIPGRIIGETIGIEAFNYAEQLFDLKDPEVMAVVPSHDIVNLDDIGSTFTVDIYFTEAIDTTNVPSLIYSGDSPFASLFPISEYWADCDHYVLEYQVLDGGETLNNIDLVVEGLADMVGNGMVGFNGDNVFGIDLESPMVTSLDYNELIVNDDDMGSDNFSVTINYSEAMDSESIPNIEFPSENPLAGSLVFSNGMWTDDMTYVAFYNVMDANELLEDIDVQVNGATDVAGNSSMMFNAADEFTIDTENPIVVNLFNELIVTDALSGTGTFTLEIEFSEPMLTTGAPIIEFPDADPMINTLTYNNISSDWSDEYTFVAYYDVMDANEDIENIDVYVYDAFDSDENIMEELTMVDLFEIDMKNPSVLALSANIYQVNQTHIGDGNFSMIVIFDEEMNDFSDPVFSFPNEDPTILSVNDSESGWINDNTYEVVFDVASAIQVLLDIDVEISDAADLVDNPQNSILFEDFFDILIETTTSVDDIVSSFDQAKLYPNPVRNGMDLIVELNPKILELDWQLLDQNGRVIQSQSSFAIADGRFVISTSGLSAGLYFVQLTDGIDSSVLKVEISK